MIKILRKKRQKGFTLIELVVVIAILGILAALAVPRFIGTLDDAKTKTDLANVRTLESALELYYAENGSYPAVADIQTELVGDYIKEWPTFKNGTVAYAITAGKGVFTYTAS